VAASAVHPLPRVAVGRHLSSESVNLENYRSWVGEALIDEIRELSSDLQGLRICNVNATAAGGGVAELLSRIIPVHLALGIAADWRLIYGDKNFFTITKSFHNALQGGELKLTAKTKQTYLGRNQNSAEMLPENYDLFIVHDPQPAALRHFKRNRRGCKWIWRCHIDSSEPNQEVWEFLHPYVQKYDAAIFTMKAFQPADLDMRRIVFIPPAIDPASTKNMELPAEVCHRAIAEMGVDLHRPLRAEIGMRS
jgi:trehalose synthase